MDCRPRTMLLFHLATIVFFGMQYEVRAQIAIDFGHGSAIALRALPSHIVAPSGELTLFADYSDVEGNALVLYMINRTVQTLVAVSDGGDVGVTLEALTERSKWERAQPKRPRTHCGNSILVSTLPPAHFFKFAGYYPSSGESAEVRYRLYNSAVFLTPDSIPSAASEKTMISLISNEGEGMVSIDLIEKARFEDIVYGDDSSFEDLSAVALRSHGTQSKKNRLRRAAAIRSLAKYPEQQTLNVLEALLLEDAPEIHDVAIQSLANISSQLAEAQEMMKRLVAHRDLRTRSTAVRALSFMPDSSATSSLLKQALEDPEPEVRSAAILALGEMAPRSLQAVTMIDELLADENPRTRAAAVYAWTKVPVSDRTVPVLHNMSQDESATVRTAVIHALSKLALELEGATAVLDELADDSDPDVRNRAASVLTIISRRKERAEASTLSSP